MFKTASLPDTILRVVQDKGTEPPFTGEYERFEGAGTYLCRQCGLALFRSDAKFHSGCGWPSFDGAILGAVKEQVDTDGHRTEILCARCDAHLGHVFSGEGFTPTNTRHCVNSLSMEFVTDQNVLDTEEAIFAAGCFWGVEFYLKQLPGVVKTEVGYTGGHEAHPTYQTICRGDTGHYEAIRVVYNPSTINYTQLTKYFFEIHDPTQRNGQGPDLGQQYMSAIFYFDEKQHAIANDVMTILTGLGFPPATKLLPVRPFYRAETYHQDYYAKEGKQPYCHRYEKKF
jgi:peptide methionine sulfoxide reductase msrA/msrB